jgi:hypothetical protein
MSPAAAVDIAICETYRGLLEDCEIARREWKQRRAEVAERGLRGKGIDDELRRLQANFAKSYAVAGNHVRDCKLCQSSRGADRHSGDESDDHVFSPGHHALSSDISFPSI